jgi:hypothetical protein
VTAPDAGRVLPIGSIYTITWDATDNRAVVSVDLHYSVDGGTNWIPIATSEANDGAYDWTVPNTGTNLGIVRVIGWDAAGNSGAGFSGPFTTADFTPPTVSILAPTNGSPLTGNTTSLVAWVATDNVAVTRIDLDFSLNNGAAWFQMATGLTNSGAYSWTVPNIQTETLLVRVTARDAAGYAASSTSLPTRIVRANDPPFAPNSPFPLEAGANVPPTSVRMQWSSGDTDGDPLTFQVLLGTNASPNLAATTSEAPFASGLLLPGTTYRWQVIASDGKASTAGPLWTFTTAAGSEPRAVLSGMELSSNGCFRVLLDGVFGKTYRLQASTDLLTWSNVLSIVPTCAAMPLTDTNVYPRPWRFYRAVGE